MAVAVFRMQILDPDVILIFLRNIKLWETSELILLSPLKICKESDQILQDLTVTTIL
jgi:hypothetical protein